MMGDFEEVWRINKNWKKELVGYMDNVAPKIERKIVIDEEEYNKLLSYKQNLDEWDEKANQGYDWEPEC